MGNWVCTKCNHKNSDNMKQREEQEPSQTEQNQQPQNNPNPSAPDGLQQPKQKPDQNQLPKDNFDPESSLETPSSPPDDQLPELELEPIFDQESEKVLNQLPQDEDNVLRYRIRQQYNRYRRN